MTNCLVSPALDAWRGSFENPVRNPGRERATGHS